MSYMTIHLIQFLLRECVLTKKELARKIGVSYRCLLDVASGHGSRRNCTEVVKHLLRFCVQNRIPLERVFEE